MTSTATPADSDQGRDAAQTLWRLGLGKGEIHDPLTPEFARAALAELESLQRGTPGALRESLEGAQMGAEQLNVESFHGLIEVVQNADDLSAGEVRVAPRSSRNRSNLLIAHNGERVQLRHVIAMTLAFVSTKRDDPRAKGRFGIGLKTLGRLGESLTVHCHPYHFTIEGNQVKTAPEAPSIQGFYDPEKSETLLDLSLREGFDVDEFRTWFSALGSESMIFLDTVRSLRLVDLGHNRTVVHHRLSEVAEESIKLPGVKSSCKKTTLRHPRTRRSWERYEVEWGMPTNLRRRYKARDATTPIAIAVPMGVDERSQIYAGLPLGPDTRLPISLNAQFEIDMARRGIQHEELNAWLFARLGELVAGAALERLASDPARAWCVIPLKRDKGAHDDSWLAERIDLLIETAQTRVRQGFRVSVANVERRRKNLVYEEESLDGLLGQAEIDGLRPGLVLLPKSARDREGRWRLVLAEIGGVAAIDVGEALKLLDWPDDDLGARDVRWFIKLARAAIEAELGSTLWFQRAVVTAGGHRIVPPLPDFEGELLLRSAQDDSLAARLGLAHVIDSSYLSRSPDAIVVRAWLEEHDMLRDVPDPEGTLRALATRGKDEEPLHLDDDDLRLMRDAFASVDQGVPDELGLEIGLVVTVDAQHWRNAKREAKRARPSESYLPASIVEGRDGSWSKAAARTPELAWIHPRYDKVLRRPGRRRRGAGEPRPLAARTFFGLLGAEIAPRLTEPSEFETRYGDPASPIASGKLAVTQLNALGHLQRHATHLKGDRRSSDLAAVLRDLQRERGLRVRRERARSLLLTLEREWSRLYAAYTSATAVFSSGSWHPAGAIPATWLANAMDEPWLTSEDSTKKQPLELAVRTPATEAVFGDDRSFFAYELDETDAVSPVVRALGIHTDPQVSEMVEQLVALRERGGHADERALALRYAAIGAACKKRDLAPDDMIGDLSVRQLRGRFGTHRTKPGLIYADGQWLPPSRVFLGAPIFGPGHPFVSDRTAADRLWRVLRIAAPAIKDCIDVLQDIARRAPDERDEQTLVNTYLYLDGQLRSASGREQAPLRELPLWTGSLWETKRPLYVVADQDVARALAPYAPVWQLPVSVSAVPALLVATGVTLLADDAFDPVVHESAFLSGLSLQAQFAAAVELLRDWLTRHDARLFEARSTSWEELARARIALDPQLLLELRLGRSVPVSVPARAHVVREPLTFYFADAEAPGEDDAGGSVVASLFTAGDSDKLALAWSRSWARAGKGERGSVTLVDEAEEGDALAALFEQAKGDGTKPRRPKSRKPGKPDTPNVATEAHRLPVRRLKRLDDLSQKTVDVTAAEDVSRKGSKGGGLRKDLPPGKPIGAPKPAPRTAPLAYSDDDRQDLALQVLQLAINGDFADLRDYTHLRGIGADALDKLKRYFEIKATYGPLPDEVTLTANEAEAAFREGSKFFLAVVAGLEEGYETVVKIFPNPLKNLNIKPSTSVTLAGIAGRRSALEVRFAQNASTAAGDTTGE